MLDITLLGTGGMLPLPGRFLTSLMVRYQGGAYLIDCGEGTQLAIRTAGRGFKQICAVLFTHFHADHIAGLPGLLLTIGNAGRSDPLTIIGPKGLEYVVRSLRVIAPELPYDVVCREIDRVDEPVCSFGDLCIRALPVPHWIPCYAYSLEVSRRGKFNVDKARELGIPIKYWSLLQSGRRLELEGRVFEPEEVMGTQRKGLKLCYATDLRPTKELAAFAGGADLFVCEGHYGDPLQQEKAEEYRHCMFSEAAAMAGEARAKELWLTHFSPSVADPSAWLSQATAIFPNTWVDRHQTTLSFSDSQEADNPAG